MSASEAEGPSETVIALVYPFVEYYDADVHGGLVCKAWRKVLLSDELWRQYIEIKLLQLNNYHERRLQNDDSYAPIDGRYTSLEHKLLDILYKESTVDRCRTLKQAFFMCNRLDSAMYIHENSGPDARGEWAGNQRTMRQKKLQQYRGIRAKIDRLQVIFNNEEDRTSSIHQMKMKLLSQAQTKQPFNHVQPRAEGAIKKVGEYILTAAAINNISLEDEAFGPSFPIQATYAEILTAIEAIAGERITPTLELQVKQTSSGGFEKQLSYKTSALSEDDWPLPLIKMLNYLIAKLWIKRKDVFLEEAGVLWSFSDEYNGDEAEREKGERLYGEEMMRWWGSLPERAQHLILCVATEQLPHLIQSDLSVSGITVETLRVLVYEMRPSRISEVLHWAFNLSATIDSQVCLQHADCFRNLIEEEYSVHRGDRSTSETDVAQLLLDIFIEILPEKYHLRMPRMTREYTDGLETAMISAMDRWNTLAEQLTEAIQSKNFLSQHAEDLLREIISIEASFNLGFCVREQEILEGHHHREYEVSDMVKRFVHQALASQSLPQNFHCDPVYSVKKKVKAVVSECRRFNEMTFYEQAEFRVRYDDAMNEFRSLSHFIHIREHALLGLIPRLQLLSDHDCDRLIYAVFSDYNATSPYYGGNVMFYDFCVDGLPCCESVDNQKENQDYADLSKAAQWVEGHWYCDNLPERLVQPRLFGLPLHENVIRSMCRFMVDNLYQAGVTPYGVSSVAPFLVREHLERFCDKNADCAMIVWDTIGLAIRNAVNVASSNWLMNDDTYQNIIKELVGMCVRTRAKILLQQIKEIYRGNSRIFVQGVIPPFIEVARMVKERKEAYGSEGFLFDIGHMKPGI